MGNGADDRLNERDGVATESDYAAGCVEAENIVTAALQRALDAWSRRDPETACEIYSHDAIMLSFSTEHVIRGRGQITDFYKQEFDKESRSARASIKRSSFSSNSTFVSGIVELEVNVEGDTDPIEQMVMLTFKREPDGMFRIIHEAS
jgi:uncharacterized protein (TIGR02246 family)